MDLEEWEILPDNDFIEINYDGGRKVIGSPDSNDFEADYFTCEPLDTREVPRTSNQITHLPVQLKPSSFLCSARDDVDRKVEVPEFDTGLGDIVSQVSFKKITRENEFVEMKMDSPKSISLSPLPLIDQDSFQFQREVETANEDEKAKEDGDVGGLNIWKRSLNGIGAICSFGVAAATFCFIVLGSQQKNKREIGFQIYAADDKNIMTQRAAKLNGAISAMRGVPVPLARAHITVGGYHNGL